jgi:hypothetical protein
MPHNSYLVHATRTSIDEICTTAKFVLHCQFVMPSMRVDRAFLINADSDASVAMATRIGSQNGVLPPRALLVTLADETSVDAWLAQSTVLPCPETTHFVAAKAASDGKRVLIELADGADWIVARRVALWAAALPATHWVEPLARSVALHNLLATGVVYNGPTTGNTPQITPQFSGQGVTVGVVDTGVDRQSCYFANGKITGYKAVSGGDEVDTSDGHGTAMAGTCCGNGGPQVGVARDASVFVVDIAAGGTVLPDVDIKAALEAAKAGGATVVVIAFGDNDEKWYPAVAADIDAFAAANPEILPVVAAGNRGYLGVPAVAGPAHAKNALVVGATQSALESFLAINAAASPMLLAWAQQYRSSVGSGVVAAFSSRGPTADGRRKPDVVAPGENIKSAAPGACADKAVKGTSVAAAAVAGAAASVSQYLKSTRPDQLVTAAMIKALIVHSAQEPFNAAVAPDAESNERVIGAGRWPSDTYGFGAVALDYVIARQGSAAPAFAIKLVEAEVGAGETNRVCFNAVGGGTFRATLVWTDAAGSPMAGKALVNDLNLVAWRGADGFEWRGNMAEEFDSVNNVEAVRFEVPSAGGQYGVAVTGNTVQQGKQKFALVVTGTGVAEVPCSEKCPINCGSPNGNCLAGQCMCSGGAQGADCGALGCPGNCGGNGKCDSSTGVCACGRGWTGASCTTAAPPQTTIVTTINRHVIDTGISTGLFAGLLVLGYFVGCFCFLFLGGFIGARLMKAKRDRQYRR